MSPGAGLDEAVAIARRAETPLVLTGAGMSQESGIPTFREATTGLWSRFDIEDLATEAAFRRNPARVFGWYAWRRELVRRAQPHAGHLALARLEARWPALQVVTQNVDGLHRRAGSRRVVELHGSLEAFRCLDGGHPCASERLDRWFDERTAAPAEGGVLEPPACLECGSPIRPGVVWFGEVLPADAVEQAWRAVSRCDALFVVGTSSLVYPAASLPEIALGRGCPVVEINPDPTPLSPQATVRWAERASVALPLLDGQLAGSGPGPGR